MTRQDETVFRTLILQGEFDDVQRHPAYRLLREMGHDVLAAHWPAEAETVRHDDGADLMVVDVCDVPDKRGVADVIAALPADRVPPQVAVFTDDLDEHLLALRRRVDARVHIFPRPLHVHGLLTILRQMNADQAALQPA